MTTFARPKSTAVLECIHNRDLESQAGTDLLFIRTADAEWKFDVDNRVGEVMLYSPKFEPDLSCAWVGYEHDFEFFEY